MSCEQAQQLTNRFYFVVFVLQNNRDNFKLSQPGK
jgi:hypothetical protein